MPLPPWASPAVERYRLSRREQFARRKAKIAETVGTSFEHDIKCMPDKKKKVFPITKPLRLSKVHKGTCVVFFLSTHRFKRRLLVTSGEVKCHRLLVIHAEHGPPEDRDFRYEIGKVLSTFAVCFFGNKLVPWQSKGQKKLGYTRHKLLRS